MLGSRLGIVWCALLRIGLVVFVMVLCFVFALLCCLVFECLFCGVCVFIVGVYGWVVVNSVDLVLLTYVIWFGIQSLWLAGLLMCLVAGILCIGG